MAHFKKVFYLKVIPPLVAVAFSLNNTVLSDGIAITPHMSVFSLRVPASQKDTYKRMLETASDDGDGGVYINGEYKIVNAEKPPVGVGFIRPEK